MFKGGRQVRPFFLPWIFDHSLLSLVLLFQEEAFYSLIFSVNQHEISAPLNIL